MPTFRATAMRPSHQRRVETNGIPGNGSHRGETFAGTGSAPGGARAGNGGRQRETPAGTESRSCGARAGNGGRRRGLLAAVLLAVAAASLFAFQPPRAGFEEGHHGWLSSHGMALARSLFVGGGLPMFTRRTLRPDGSLAVEAYDRFPFVPFLAVGAAAELFPRDLAAQVRAGRVVMLAFFALAMGTCLLALRRLVEDDLVALLAVLATFSSHFMSVYDDMIFNDVPALFGVSLVLLLVAEAERGSPGRLPAAAGAVAAVSLGWQPLAVLGCWALADAFVGLRLRRTAGTARWTAILARPSVVALGAGLAAAAGILAVQLWREWAVAGGSFLELPTVHSALWRLGLVEGEAARFADRLRWRAFVAGEVRRVDRMVVPFAGILRLELFGRARFLPAAAVIAALFLAAARRHGRRLGGVPLFVFLASGLAWSLGMHRFVAFHDFQAIFWVGVPLAFWTLLALSLPPRFRAAAAVAACLLFVSSTFVVDRDKQRVARTVEPVTAEFQAILDHLPPGSRVFVDGDRHRLGIGHHAVDFYLVDTIDAPRDLARFAVSADPHFPGRRLTENARVNLFRLSPVPGTGRSPGGRETGMSGTGGPGLPPVPVGPTNPARY